MADTLESLEIQIKYKASSAASEIRKTTGAVKSLSKETEKAKTPLNNFIASLKRIAFYRILRSIIKNIGQALQEGLQYAYAFSQGINTEGHRFAEAMDSMKSATTQMKAQLGSAFIGLLAAIAPVVIQIVNLVTKLADALAQLFAAFTGKTYLKANAVADKFADTMKAGGAAANEWKNQLLGFDEINRLNEPNQGGGGGGSSAIDPSSLFEDSPINEKLLAFIDRLKSGLQPAIERCKEAFDRLKEAWGRLVEAFSQEGAFKDFVSDLLILGGDLVINGITLLTDALTLLLDVLTALQTGDWSSVWDSFTQVIKDAWQAVTDFVWDGLILLADAIDALIPGEQHLADQLRAVKEGTAEVTEVTEDGIKTIYTIADASQDAAAKFNGTYRPSVEQTSKAVSNFANDLYLFGNDVSAFISSLFQPLADFCAWIDSAIQGISIFKGLGGRVNQMHTDGSVYLQGFASGGFPDDGQLFIANEAGAEMVGSIGGRTAVANNQEITEGIRAAVYDAMVASNANGNNDVSVRVYLDSREIKAGQQRLNRAWGVG